MADIVLKQVMPIKLAEVLTPQHLEKRLQLAVEETEELQSLTTSICEHPDYFMPVVVCEFFFVGYHVDTSLCQRLINETLAKAEVELFH